MHLYNIRDGFDLLHLFLVDENFADRMPMNLVAPYNHERSFFDFNYNEEFKQSEQYYSQNNHLKIESDDSYQEGTRKENRHIKLILIFTVSIVLIGTISI